MPILRLPQAVRALVRTPLVSLVAILSLALGIGANAAIFSLFDEMLLRPLPVAHPEQLVNYVGLNPAFDDSGESEWSGGIGGHGNKHLRGLLIEGAQAILRCSQTALALWGRKLLARKGSRNLAVAAVARKLIVAVWYLLRGRWTPLEEIDQRLAFKVGTIIGSVGSKGLAHLGKSRKLLREEIYQRLKTGRVYVLDPNKKFTPHPQPLANPA